MKQKMIDYYMSITEKTAELSYATKLKVGAIAVKNDRIISIGYNGTPHNWSNVCEDQNGVTYPYVSHAEENLIAKLCKSHESSEGASVFITDSPCMNCSKILYNAGVTSVYYKREYRLTDGIDFLKKCGVNVVKVS